MGETALRSDERIGLGVAVVLHAALLALLLLQPAPSGSPAVPERMTVSLAEDVGLTAMAPDPVSESRAAIAPTLSDEPLPAPVQQAAPDPAPRPQTVAPPASRPARTTQRRRPDRPASRTREQPAAAPTRSGGSRIGADFLPGSGDSTTTEDTRLPASQIGASARASLVQAIARKIKPHWQPPSGPEVDQIVTVLRFRLNEDGSLAGRPSVVRQTGVNDTNRAQADRHAEQAIRAVQLADPFDLPPEYYNAWKNITAFSFDWKLSQ